MRLIKHKRKICEFGGCSNDAKYAMYRLRFNDSKVWGHFCDEHQRAVFEENQRLRKKHPETIYKEVDHESN